jgi:hypothetical protein
MPYIFWVRVGAVYPYLQRILRVFHQSLRYPPPPVCKDNARLAILVRDSGGSHCQKKFLSIPYAHVRVFILEIKTCQVEFI